MNSKITIFIFILLLSLLSAGFIYSQDNPLELEYPEVAGYKPETVDTPVVEYFRYIFNFIIAILVTAEAIFVIRGLYYIISAPSPAKVQEARKSLWAAVLGIIILLSAWLLLFRINPQLVAFRLPKLESITTEPLLPIADSYIPPSDLLKRIRNLAEKTKSASQEIEDMVQDISFFISKCDCSYTLPACLCSGGDKDSACQPYQCYVGPGGYHPCPDWKIIQQFQKSIVDWRDVLLYYKNRAFAERKDLKNDIESSLDIKIEHYENLLTKELGKNQPDQSIIEFTEEQLKKLRKEKNYKKALMEKLADLGSLIAGTKQPITQIAQLPGQCPANVAKKCKATCKIGPDYGCHDRSAGCQPDICKPVDPDNPNPCPIEEIEKQAEKIKKLSFKIVGTPKNPGICDEIITIINNIR